MAEFRMPSLGADMDSGRIAEWLVAPGDVVHKGQTVAVVDTSKAAIEVEVFTDGTVTELLVEPGVEVPVGTALARIEEGAAPQPGPSAEPPSVESPSAETLVKPPLRHLAHQLGVDLAQVHGTGEGGRITRADIQAAASAVAPTEPAAVAPPPPAQGATRVEATPRARALAASRGIDLAGITGSGAHRRILAKDIPEAPAQPASTTTTPVQPDAAQRKQQMRTAIATLMGRSAVEIPHYYVATTVDLAATLTWLRDHNEHRAPQDRLLPVAVIMRAVVRAAQDVPDLNGHWVNGELRPSPAVDLGVAVAQRTGGLVTPRIQEADRLDVDGLMAALANLVRRARRGGLKADELQPGSITVSSLADGGPDALYGVIYPPQVALVGVGAIRERPWAIGGMLTVRPTTTLTLAADHRATDGRTGAAFLDRMTQLLSEPEEL